MTRHTTIAIALAAAASLAACGQPAETASDKPRGVPVRAAAVERRDIDDMLVLAGTLKPRAQVQVVAEVSARLLEIEKDEGARVARGEVLARLDDTDYRLAFERAKAALEVADAGKAHALVERDRADNLLKTGGITDKDHLSAQVNLRVAEASLAEARAAAAIAEQQFARCTVKAPFAGRVAKRLVDAGAQLAAGTPIFTLVDDAVLEFRASVPSEDYAKVKRGDPASLVVDALDGLEVKGNVARVTPLVDERSRSFEVVVEVPGGKDLVGGLFARARVRVGRVTGALVVPPAAVLRDGAGQRDAQAFVVAGGKAERRALKLGVETAGAIQVAEGLAEGDLVVLDPPTALSAGAPVEIQQNGRK